MTINRDAIYREDLGRLTPRLRQVARALVLDHAVASADDLVQATLVRALSADERRNGDRLSVWLFSLLVAAHRAHIHALTAGRRITVGGSVPSGAGAAPSRAGATSGSMHDPIGLSDVPLECREVLVLVTLGKLSYVQVAETLNVSIATITSRLSRARDHLADVQHEGRPHFAPATRPPGQRRPAASHLRVVK